jgi:hypothetical protein
MANGKRVLLFHPDGKREFAPMIDGLRLSATLGAIPGRQLRVFTEGVGERNSAVDLMTSEFSVATSALHGRALQETSTRKDWEFFEPGEAEARRRGKQTSCEPSCNGPPTPLKLSRKDNGKLNARAGRSDWR